MNKSTSYLSRITDRGSVITAIDLSPRFPEFLKRRMNTYGEEVEIFRDLVLRSDTSAKLLKAIRNNKDFDAKRRMSFLKIFRRVVSPIVDTEMAKKLKVPTSQLVELYGESFKDIDLLKSQFRNLPDEHKYALVALIGEYDDRGKSGYALTDTFFSWFESNFGDSLTIEGPRGAGKDIQLSSVFPEYIGDFPCDFIIRDAATEDVLVIGFARYDSTRGGSQSDDRTGGNNDKVLKSSAFKTKFLKRFKVLFLSDGPGLMHNDTWTESCLLDGAANDHVRVVTLKLAKQRVTEEWMTS